MKQPLWLAELHRQWQRSRGRHLDAWSKPFVRKWQQLLEDAGLLKAEDQKTAEREARRLQGEGLLLLKVNKYRTYLIEGVILPLTSEGWLRKLFSTASPQDLLQESLQHLAEAESWLHGEFPELWRDWLMRLEGAFRAGHGLHPLSWRRPEVLRRMLRMVYELTHRRWSADTLVREASRELGPESKELEKSRRLVESCLASLFGQPMTLEQLGIQGKAPKLEVAGELKLGFSDGTEQHFHALRSSFFLGEDLRRASWAQTCARRILCVENSKTTLRRLALLNETQDTLILACAYPTQALLLLLALLPPDLPIYHFGDTDPAGYLILAKLRQAVARPVLPFAMVYRSGRRPAPLTDYDRKILPGLLAEPALADVRPSLLEIEHCDDKGDYEQEGLGVPGLPHWPFYRAYADQLGGAD